MWKTCDLVAAHLAGEESLRAEHEDHDDESQRGDLALGADPAALATQTLAILQGGLLLTQVRRDPGQMRVAADAALALIRAAGRINDSGTAT